MRLVLFSFCLSLFVWSCRTAGGVADSHIRSLNFLAEYTLPHKLQFAGTTVGGLSSIDYNAAEDSYYLICDDRSDINPARFYTAKIKISNRSIDSVWFTNVTTLQQPGGNSFPARKVDSLHVADPEAMRYNPLTQTLVWSSEGERMVKGGQSLLVDPFIHLIQPQGKYIDSFFLPPNLSMRAVEKGPRQNGVLEGLAFSPDYKQLYASTEDPLFEDGQKSGLFDTTGWIRLFTFDVATRKPAAQYAYQLDPVVREPISQGLFITNGVSDILAVNDHQLLVTERSFSTGRLGCNVRVYLAELKGAEDISGIPSLLSKPARNPIKKKLLLNMDTLGRWIDNVEGATFGPRLPNGNRSLLFVTDDNFSAEQQTQIFLFEIL